MLKTIPNSVRLKERIEETFPDGYANNAHVKASKNYYEVDFDVGLTIIERNIFDAFDVKMLSKLYDLRQVCISTILKQDIFYPWRHVWLEFRMKNGNIFNHCDPALILNFRKQLLDDRKLFSQTLDSQFIDKYHIWPLNGEFGDEDEDEDEGDVAVR